RARSGEGTAHRQFRLAAGVEPGFCTKKPRETGAFPILWRGGRVVAAAALASRTGLARVMLDDQTLFDRSGDVVAVGQTVDGALEPVVVGQQPGRGRAGGVGGLTRH